MQSGTGGKVFVLTASIPSIGAGELKNREDARLMGTPKVSIFDYGFYMELK
jgi:protein transport protein SEC24